jgi:hypothetical protein
MMRTAVLMVAGALAALLLSSPAHADPFPAPVARVADALRCHHRVATSMPGAPANKGVQCTVPGQGTYSLLRFRSPGKAVRWLSSWLCGRSEIGGYAVRYGSVIVLPGGYAGRPALYALTRLRMGRLIVMPVDC